ncbi:unnamed protein product [Pleuronectes platessa]|uniref:Uncharacterized protein n=1 Tax=Pleuronectes platessa TaxID=8262 RepID=A0A9N7VJR8_PLEPL|nr:unnamed protein product [Pleuronectes platessa]
MFIQEASSALSEERGSGITAEQHSSDSFSIRSSSWFRREVEQPQTQTGSDLLPLLQSESVEDPLLFTLILVRLYSGAQEEEEKVSVILQRRSRDLRSFR